MLTCLVYLKLQVSHKNTRFSIRVHNSGAIAKYQDSVGATCRSSMDPVDVKGEGVNGGVRYHRCHTCKTHIYTHTQPTVEAGEACFQTGTGRCGDQLDLGGPGKFLGNH